MVDTNCGESPADTRMEKRRMQIQLCDFFFRYTAEGNNCSNGSNMP